MKICTKCNRQYDDSKAFCPECGTPLVQQAAGPQGQQGNTPHYGNPGGSPPPSNFSVRSRSIPLCIIFSLLTCGIYGIYWMIVLNDEVNLVSGEPQATSGGMVFLFSVITCGIYGWYWLYKMGERCDRIKGTPAGSSNVIYLILGIFGLSIVSYCLIQDTLNKTA